MKSQRIWWLASFGVAAVSVFAYIASAETRAYRLQRTQIAADHLLYLGAENSILLSRLPHEQQRLRVLEEEVAGALEQIPPLGEGDPFQESLRPLASEHGVTVVELRETDRRPHGLTVDVSFLMRVRAPARALDGFLYDVRTKPPIHFINLIEAELGEPGGDIDVLITGATIRRAQ